MLDKVDAWLRLNALGFAKPIDEIKNALINIDQQGIFDEERSRYVAVVWDKVSDINNIAAGQILARDDYLPDGEVYLLYIDGGLTYLQTHDPKQAGFAAMSADSALLIANQQADQLAWAAAHERIFRLLLEQML